jgi:hypothetical protein
VIFTEGALEGGIVGCGVNIMMGVGIGNGFDVGGLLGGGMIGCITGCLVGLFLAKGAGVTSISSGFVHGSCCSCSNLRDVKRVRNLFCDL